MDVRMRIFIAVITILALLYVVHAIRKNYIDIRHSLVWMFTGVLLLVVDAFPALLHGISGLLGFELPVNMLFFLGFTLAIMIIFDLTAKVSRQNEQLKQLAQEVALLQKDTEEKLMEEKE